VTWLDSVTTKKIPSVVFFYKLTDGLTNLGREYQVGDASLRFLLVKEAVRRFVATQRGDIGACTSASSSQSVGQLRRKHAMLLVLFFSNRNCSGCGWEPGVAVGGGA